MQKINSENIFSKPTVFILISFTSLLFWYFTPTEYFVSAGYRKAIFNYKAGLYIILINLIWYCGYKVGRNSKRLVVVTLTQYNNVFMITFILGLIGNVMLLFLKDMPVLHVFNPLYFPSAPVARAAMNTIPLLTTFSQMLMVAIPLLMFTKYKKYKLIIFVLSFFLLYLRAKNAERTALLEVIITLYMFVNIVKYQKLELKNVFIIVGLYFLVFSFYEYYRTFYLQRGIYIENYYYYYDKNNSYAFLSNRFIDYLLSSYNYFIGMFEVTFKFRPGIFFYRPIGEMINLGSTDYLSSAQYLDLGNIGMTTFTLYGEFYADSGFFSLGYYFIYAYLITIIWKSYITTHHPITLLFYMPFLMGIYLSPFVGYFTTFRGTYAFIILFIILRLNNRIKLGSIYA